MKKIRKALAGITVLSVLVSNSIYISAAENTKKDLDTLSAFTSKKDVPKLDERIKQLEDSGLGISEILNQLAEDGTWGEVAVKLKVKSGEEIPKLKEYHYIQQYWEDDVYVIGTAPKDLIDYVSLDIVENAEFYFTSTSSTGLRAEKVKQYRWLLKNGEYTEDTFVFLEFPDDFDINEVLLPNSEVFETGKIGKNAFYYIHASKEVMFQYIDWFENYEGEDLKAFFIERPGVMVSSDDGNYTVNDSDLYLLGDIISDDIIDVSDLTELSLALIGDNMLTEVQQKAADIDGDEAVTLADLARLQQYLSKKIDSLR